MENRHNTPKEDEVLANQTKAREKADGQVENNPKMKTYNDLIKIKTAYTQIAKELKEEIENQKANGSQLSVTELNQLSADIDQVLTAADKESVVYFNILTRYKNHLSNKLYQGELKKLESPEEMIKRHAKRTSSIFTEPKLVVSQELQKNKIVAQVKVDRKVAEKQFMDSVNDLKSTVKTVNTKLGKPIKVIKRAQEIHTGTSFGIFDTLEQDVRNAKDLVSLKSSAQGLDDNFSLDQQVTKLDKEEKRQAISRERRKTF